jgi:hypothetical protein
MHETPTITLHVAQRKRKLKVKRLRGLHKWAYCKQG